MDVEIGDLQDINIDLLGGAIWIVIVPLAILVVLPFVCKHETYDQSDPPLDAGDCPLGDVGFAADIDGGARRFDVASGPGAPPAVNSSRPKPKHGGSRVRDQPDGSHCWNSGRCAVSTTTEKSRHKIYCRVRHGRGDFSRDGNESFRRWAFNQSVPRNPNRRPTVYPDEPNHARCYSSRTVVTTSGKIP